MPQLIYSPWAKFCGKGNDATQTNASDEPVFMPNAQAVPAAPQIPGAPAPITPTLPAVQFGASGNQSLTIAGQVISSAQFTIIAVLIKGVRSVAAARAIYAHNDRRAEVKRRINELLGSDLIEEKSYGPA